MIESAAKMGDKLIVIVNNDKQQVIKKGKIILDESNSLRLIRAMREVDEAILSIDTNDTSQTKTLESIRSKYPGDELIFANGGDTGLRARRCLKMSMTCARNVISQWFLVWEAAK